MAIFRSEKDGNLTDADRRFLALRKSGYTGPIDQNGRKAETGRPAEILAALRDRT